MTQYLHPHEPPPPSNSLHCGESLKCQCVSSQGCADVYESRERCMSTDIRMSYICRFKGAALHYEDSLKCQCVSIEGCADVF